MKISIGNGSNILFETEDLIDRKEACKNKEVNKNRYPISHLCFSCKHNGFREDWYTDIRNNTAFKVNVLICKITNFIMPYLNKCDRFESLEDNK